MISDREIGFFLAGVVTGVAVAGIVVGTRMNCQRKHNDTSDSKNFSGSFANVNGDCKRCKKI